MKWGLIEIIFGQNYPANLFADAFHCLLIVFAKLVCNNDLSFIL